MGGWCGSLAPKQRKDGRVTAPPKFPPCWRLKIPPSPKEVGHGEHGEIGEAVVGACRRWGGRADQPEYLGRSARSMGAGDVEEGDCGRAERGHQDGAQVVYQGLGGAEATLPGPWSGPL